MSRNELSRKDLPALILAVLDAEPRHGYAIARAVEERSGRTLTLREGALYPALRGLENDGMIVGAWETPASGPARKVYRLTEAGSAALAERRTEWRRYAALMDGFLGGEPDAQPA